MIGYLKGQYRLYTLKQPLIKAFEASGLYLKYKNGGGKELHILPTIHSVSEASESTTYTFTLPVGVDPLILEKKRYCFTQVFGEHIEYNGTSKNITLTVHKKVREVQPFDYDYDSIKHALNKYMLPIYCGTKLDGQAIVYDMVEQPHLLVAGETGSGKSTQLRSILTTLVHSTSPNELRMYLADMKRSEFHLFRNVKHVEEVCNKASDLSMMLNQLHYELEKRGDFKLYPIE
jgi:DNA segregation ATPase FtsK/SpoIIIE, S-DNA-T family